jgi:hypothetical protein
LSKRLVLKSSNNQASLKIVPTTNDGESSIYFQQKADPTVGTGSWVVGQGSYGVGAGNFSFAKDGIGLVLSLNGTTGSISTPYNIFINSSQVATMATLAPYIKTAITNPAYNALGINYIKTSKSGSDITIDYTELNSKVASIDTAISNLSSTVSTNAANAVTSVQIDSFTNNYNYIQTSRLGGTSFIDYSGLVLKLNSLQNDVNTANTGSIKQKNLSGYWSNQTRYYRLGTLNLQQGGYQARITLLACQGYGFSNSFKTTTPTTPQNYSCDIYIFILEMLQINIQVLEIIRLP